MIIDVIRRIVEKEGGSNPLFLRILIKEALQDCILYFIYNQEAYKELIFTGGTALRKIYGLPRLSEDIDFDSIKPFDIQTFTSDVLSYFTRNLQYREVGVKISGNRKTVFIKFSNLLRELELVKNRSDATQLFVRVDFSIEKLGEYGTEVRLVTTSEFTFFVKAYDLSSLFTNKIIAFLQRDFFRGKTQTVAFKGRDVFDLVWFFERRQKTVELNPRWERLYKALGVNTKEEIIRQLVEKIKRLNPADVLRDLAPFIQSPQTVVAFSEHFDKILFRGVQSLASPVL